MHDLIQATRKFNLAAGRTEDRFDPRAIALHIGLQLEEMAEVLEAVCQHDHIREMDVLSLQHVLKLAQDMQAIGNNFKNAQYDGSVLNADRVGLLDGCLDVIVVSLGNIMSQGADMLGAASEVAEKNLQKIGPDGVCIKNSAGKIQKPPGWTPPALLQFVAAPTSDEISAIRSNARL